MGLLEASARHAQKPDSTVIRRMYQDIPRGLEVKRGSRFGCVLHAQHSIAAFACLTIDLASRILDAPCFWAIVHCSTPVSPA